MSAGYKNTEDKEKTFDFDHQFKLTTSFSKDMIQLSTQEKIQGVVESKMVEIIKLKEQAVKRVLFELGYISPARAIHIKRLLQHSLMGSMSPLSEHAIRGAIRELENFNEEVEGEEVE